MTATQSGRSTVPRVLIHPPGCQPTRTGRTLLVGFGWFCRLLPRTGLANGTEEAAGWRNALLTASRFSTLQEERREGKTENSLIGRSVVSALDTRIAPYSVPVGALASDTNVPVRSPRCIRALEGVKHSPYVTATWTF